MAKEKAKKIIIGIVGGTGKMGQLFMKFFEKRAFKVLISSRKTALTNIKLAKLSDVIIVSVPLGVVVKVINEVVPFIKKDTLLIDISAVKEEPVKAMLKSKASVIGMHPVFGPMVKSFKNQTIVLCPGRGKKWFLWLKEIFESSGVHVKISTPKEHDQMMAVIQGLTHFTAISMGYALKNLKVNIKKSLNFVSPNYKLQINLVGRILTQNPAVYADISIYNKYIKEVVLKYQEASRELLESVLKKDKNRFSKIFKESANYLGKYKYEALRETNYVIETIMRKKCKKKDQKLLP